MLPSGDLPKFNPLPPDVPQGRFAVEDRAGWGRSVAIPDRRPGICHRLHERRRLGQPLGRIEIRGRTWLNWLYPLPF
jgi:hypothetical protein